MKKIPLLLCVFVSSGVFAQTGTTDAADLADGLPRGYRAITLGMGIEELKEALRRDTEIYLFREDRDVYDIPLRNENYVETTGRGFVKRGFFQLKDESLFVISLELNPDRMDYYSVFTAFRERYGEPDSLDPQKAMWESETARVFIERPLTVKYIDRAVFDAILAEAEAGESAEKNLRKDFLSDF
jgi:hypothetical protein